MVRRGYLVEQLDDKGKGTGKFETTAAGEALLQQMELQKKVHLDALSGIAREREAAKEKYNEEIDRLNQFEKIASAQTPGGQTQAQRDLASRLPQMKADIQAAYKNALADLDIKQDTSAKTTVSQSDIRQKDAQNFAETNKQIEDQITEQVMQSGKTRESFYREEYQMRINAAMQALYSGEIG